MRVPDKHTIDIMFNTCRLSTNKPHIPLSLPSHTWLLAPGHLLPPTDPAHGYGGMSQEFLQTSIERAFASMATRYGHPSTWQTSGPPAQAPHEVMDEHHPSRVWIPLTIFRTCKTHVPS
ncbi:unnamed protein product [Meganyctiphanes norvegica]|uniref:Uncharacterized protein n=1 Tax=Meganyctiphanes norvegica TaxID=48144 RepID=A0AAV2QDK5_MEGNR